MVWSMRLFMNSTFCAPFCERRGRIGSGSQNSTWSIPKKVGISVAWELIIVYSYSQELDLTKPSSSEGKVVLRYGGNHFFASAVGIAAREEMKLQRVSTNNKENVLSRAQIVVPDATAVCTSFLFTLHRQMRSNFQQVLT